MRRRRTLLAIPPLLAVAALVAIGLWLVANGDRLGWGPVYGVAQVRAGLEADPRHWVGRTVRVAGSVTAAGCAACDARRGDPPHYVLSPPDEGRGGAPGLILVAGPADDLLARLRRLPVLSGLLPAPQALALGRPATYRLRLEQQLPGDPLAHACSAPVCYWGLLLDPVPRQR